MLAGTLGVLDAPADEPLEDTTSDGHLPALGVNATQSNLAGDGVAQSCTAAGRIEQEREVPVVYDGGVTTEMEPQNVEVAADLVADVTGEGVVMADRLAGGGDIPFPFNLVSAQTGQWVQRHEVDVQAFARSWDDDALRDTWLVGVEDADADGVSMDYNDRADKHDAPEASVGLGFTLSWEDTIASGVLYQSGYLAIYSPWTAAVFLTFVADAVLPHARPTDDAAQATLS